MYAVNYKNKRGFTVVGASRKYFPILAYANNGKFEGDFKDTGVDYWIEEQKEIIEFIDSQSIIDYGADWFKYMNNRGKDSIFTKSGDPINHLRDSCIAIWESQGYNCYELLQQPSYMPDDVYAQFCSTAESISNPDYSYMSCSVILERIQSSSYSTGNLVSACWGQRNHYNDSIKSGPNDDPYLGCTTVAAGQIMKYYEYPYTFDWNSMSDYYATPAAASLLKNIHDRIVWFGGSTSDPWSAKNYLVEKGYSNAYVQSHSISTVQNNLIAGHPVLMSGSTGASSGGHSWVCSGYSSNSVYYDCSLQVVSVVAPPLQYENAGVSYSGSSSGYYFYMNWGGEGAYNGWFMSDSVKMNSDHNYKYNRTEIVDIYPTN